MLSKLVLSVAADNGLLFDKGVSKELEPDSDELLRLFTWLVVLRKLWEPNGLLFHEFKEFEDWWPGDEEEEKNDEDVEVGENLSLEDGDE